MKKVLFGLLAVAMAIGLAGAAFAQFTDTETSEDNTFNAGTLDLTMAANGGAPVNGGNAVIGPFNNLAPGSQPKGKFTLTNIGSVAGFLDIEGIVVESLENLPVTEPELQSGDIADDPAGELDDNLNIRIFHDLDGDGWMGVGETVYYNGLVSGLPSFFDLDEPVPAGGGIDIVTEIYDWWAGQGANDNLAQSDSLKIDFVFELRSIAD